MISLAELRDYAYLMRLHRPIGIWLLMWPMLWALWLAAGGLPDLRVLVVMLAGTVLMRSAGCIINDFADRDFDPHVRRTRDRPLAARRIAPQSALLLFAALIAASFLLVLQLDRYTILLSFVGAGLAISYPFFKRFFPAPHATRRGTVPSSARSGTGATGGTACGTRRAKPPASATHRRCSGTPRRPCGSRRGRRRSRSRACWVTRRRRW